MIVAGSIFLAPIATSLTVGICIVPWYYLLFRARRLRFITLYITSVLTFFVSLEIPWHLFASRSFFGEIISRGQAVLSLLAILAGLYSVLFVLFWFGSRPNKK